MTQARQQEHKQQNEEDARVSSIDFASAASFADEDGGRYWEDNEKKEKNSNRSEEIGVLFAGTFRALLLSLKKQSINFAIRRRAFRAIGDRTTTADTLQSSSSPSPQTTTHVPCTTKKTLPIWIRATAIFGLITKNIIYGLTVFGVYDLITSKYHHIHHNQNPFFLHFMSGSCAGLAQSSLLYLSELFHDYVVLKKLPKSPQKPKQQHPRAYLHNRKYLFRRMVHHMLGYATLFGVYEFIRINLEQSHLFKEGEDQQKNNHNHHYQSVLYYPNKSSLLCCFIAGGIAGQSHYVLSHYTTHWKSHAIISHDYTKQQGPKGALANVKKTEISDTHQKQKLSSQRKSLSSSFLKHMPKRPSARSVLASFLPTSVAFVAYEYGGTFVTSNMMDLEEKSVG